MVEFAFVGPMAFLLLLGIVVIGIVAANQNLFSNGVRDVARAAAICGGLTHDSQTQLPPAGSQAAQLCSWSNFDTYTQARLSLLAGKPILAAQPVAGRANCQLLPSGAALVCFYDATDTAVPITVPAAPLSTCQSGFRVEISSQYDQPLYLPLVGNFVGNKGSNSSRTLTSDAEATCEQ